MAPLRRQISFIKDSSGFNNAPHPAETLVQLTLEGQPLQALLTKQSVERLGLQVGQLVYAQIKAVALD